MAVLVDRSVPRTLVTMAAPMLAGTFAMNAYSLTDTWFVSQLGTLPLAAMGFSFPVVMLVRLIAGGVGTGVTTLMSHAIGRHDHEQAAKLVTRGLVMVVAVALVMSVIGLLTMRPIFRALGAGDETMPLIEAYMTTWYLGSVFMAIPMVGNGILISAGDSRGASGFMMFGTLLNLALDPIMIFGLFGFPELGIQGAALATVLAQAIASAWMLLLLARRHNLLVGLRPMMSGFLESARRVTGFAVPSALSMALMPISATVITKLLSWYGPEAVAASGAAGRIEMFAFVVPMALGISLTPFVSQNFGAGRVDRVREAQRWSTVFSLVYGGVVAVVFFFAAPAMASVFTDDPEVMRVIVLYIRIIAWGYGMLEVHRYSGFILTGMHRPTAATILNAARVLVLLIPLSLLGSAMAGIEGMFVGRLVTDLLVGVVGIWWAARVLMRARPEEASEEPPSGEPMSTGPLPQALAAEVPGGAPAMPDGRPG